MPPGNAVARAREPEFWQWHDPQHQYVVLIAEMLSVLMAKTPNETKARRSDMLRVRRPGETEKNVKKLGAEAVPLAELEAWLSGDFVPVEE